MKGTLSATGYCLVSIVCSAIWLTSDVSAAQKRTASEMIALQRQVVNLKNENTQLKMLLAQKTREFENKAGALQAYSDNIQDQNARDKTILGEVIDPSKLGNNPSPQYFAQLLLSYRKIWMAMKNSEIVRNASDELVRNGNVISGPSSQNH